MSPRPMVLSKVGVKTFPLYRKVPGYRDPNTGRWIEGAEETLEVRGNEQPLSSYEKQMLPDALRTRDTRFFISSTFLNTLDEADGQSPDELLIEGYRYQVFARESFQMRIRKHYEYKLVRVEQSAGG